MENEDSNNTVNSNRDDHSEYSQQLNAAPPTSSSSAREKETPKPHTKLLDAIAISVLAVILVLTGYLFTRSASRSKTHNDTNNATIPVTESKPSVSNIEGMVFNTGDSIYYTDAKNENAKEIAAPLLDPSDLNDPSEEYYYPVDSFMSLDNKQLYYYRLASKEIHIYDFSSAKDTSLAIPDECDIDTNGLPGIIWGEDNNLYMDCIPYSVYKHDTSDNKLKKIFDYSSRNDSDSEPDFSSPCLTNITNNGEYIFGTVCIKAKYLAQKYYYYNTQTQSFDPAFEGKEMILSPNHKYGLSRTLKKELAGEENVSLGYYDVYIYDTEKNTNMMSIKDVIMSEKNDEMKFYWLNDSFFTINYEKEEKMIIYNVKNFDKKYTINSTWRIDGISPDESNIIYYRKDDDSTHLIIRDLASGDNQEIIIKSGSFPSFVGWIE